MAGLAEILEENGRLREQLVAREEALRRAALGAQTQRETLQAAHEAERETLQAQHEADRRELEAKVAAIQTRAEQLAWALELLRLRKGGPASQRYVPDEQESFPFPDDILAPPRLARPGAEEEEEGDEANRGANGPKRRGTPRRRNLADDTKHKHRTVRCPAQEDQDCARCGKPLSVFGQARSHRIEWVPGHFVIDDVVRDKCACRDCPGEGVLTVPGPYALDRALCGDGLLCRVIVDKFCDHLPLNRQAQRMAREGFEVGSNTLSGWIGLAAEIAKILASAVRADLMQASCLQGDDTGHPIQDGGHGTLRKGRLWVFTDQQQALYAFTPTKEGIYPAELLRGFEGNGLLVDGGSEFNRVVRDNGLERGGCWSHLRSYFWDARHHHPAEAQLALGTIHDLFLLERSFKGKEPDEIMRLRQAHTRPLVEGFLTWLEALSTTVRPSTELAKAVTYGRNQEAALRVHLKRGDVPMHNNLSELLLRQPVVGRKNWLFNRSEGGAEGAAAFFTLVGSCKLQGLDPHAYLVDVMRRVQDHPANRIRELTPRAWRLARAREPASIEAA